MPTLTDLQHEMRAKSLEADAIIKNNDMTPAEKVQKLRGDNGDDGLNAEIKSLSNQIADLAYLDEQHKSLSGIINEDPGADTTPNHGGTLAAKSMAQQFVESDEFTLAAKAIGNGGRTSTTPVELKGFLHELGLKASLESGLTSAEVIAQDRVPGIVPILFERLTVADLMPNTTTNSNVVRAVVESTATNNAVTVAEGAAKPASVLNYNIVDEPVRKIANYIKVSDEMLEDFSLIQGEIQGRLALFVRLQEEAQILTGDGSGTNLTGILNRSLTAAQAKSTDTVADAVHKEITKIRVASFLDPDAIVWHPSDWEGAALEKDTNGQYYGNGPFTGAYGNAQNAGNGTYVGNYWGLRSVVTTGMTQNTALIGAFALGASVVRRKGVTVTMTNSDQDDFVKNLVTILAEERLALRVIRPSAFGTVTGV